MLESGVRLADTLTHTHSGHTHFFSRTTPDWHMANRSAFQLFGRCAADGWQRLARSGSEGLRGITTSSRTEAAQDGTLTASTSRETRAAPLPPSAADVGPVPCPPSASSGQRLPPPATLGNSVYQQPLTAHGKRAADPGEPKYTAPYWVPPLARQDAPPVLFVDPWRSAEDPELRRRHAR
jgi:hypothetical protein